MKRYSKACERNQEPIGDVLAEVLAPSATVLEVGSGTGQHAAAFAKRFSGIIWQPTNRPGRLDSIRAWRRDADLENICAPLEFDLFDDNAPIDEADAVMATNVIHIAPWEAVDRLFFHASQVLNPGGLVILYGPYRYEGRPLEPSNERFDQHLRARDPKSGIRLFEEVDEVAQEYGFSHRETRRLPANNDIHWWVKS